MTLRQITEYINRIDMGPFIRIDVTQSHRGFDPPTIEFRFMELVPIWHHGNGPSPFHGIRRDGHTIAFPRADFELKEWAVIHEMYEVEALRGESEFFSWFHHTIRDWMYKRLEDMTTIHPPGYRPERGRPARQVLYDELERRTPRVDVRNPYRDTDWDRIWHEMQAATRPTNASADVQPPAPPIVFDWDEDDLGI